MPRDKFGKTRTSSLYWNYKALFRKIKEDIYKWRATPFSWINGLKVVKMSVLSKMIYRVNTIPVKMLIGISKFYMDSKADSSVHLETQRIWNSLDNFEINRKAKLQELHFLISRLLLKLH